LVPEAIVQAAEHFKRDIYGGGADKLGAAAAHYTPRTLDRYMRRFLFSQQKSGRPARDRGQHSLYEPGADLIERSGHGGRVLESRLYTRAAMHSKTVAGLLIGSGLALAAWWRLRQRTVGV